MLARERNELASDTRPANCQGGLVIEPSFLSPSSRGPSYPDLGSEKGEDDKLVTVVSSCGRCLPPRVLCAIPEDLANLSLWGLPASSEFKCSTGNGRGVGNGLFLAYWSVMFFKYFKSVF